MSKIEADTLGTPGAIESNAGDDYHILWACRRALRLLDPSYGLSLIRVEGVSRKDEISVVDPDSFLAVDISEYFGGTSIDDATRVVISQLKYSQRHPDRPWTAARLCEKTGGKQERSVIARLAQAFAGYYEGDAGTSVIERLCIKLVSNRPADQALVQAIKASQDWLESRQTVKTAQLLAGLSDPHKDVIKRFQKACILNSEPFCDFLRCLDFSDCNSDSRLWQRLRLTQEIGSIAPASPAERVRDLYDRVAQEALPKVGELGLIREDVLAALGCHGFGSIFPASSRFEPLHNPINTPDAQRIVEALQASPLRRLLAHGAGGVGKTSTVLSLPNNWTEANWIFYDCFGGGTYKNSPGDERHSTQRALLQLSNELAVQCGTPFLIRAPDGKDDLWREFRKRLEAASDIFKKLGESLVLVIDAADNSIQAADTPEDTFVTGLWQIDLPDNVFLLMTARSGGRANSLQAPSDTPRIELTGFNLESTAQHLRRNHSSVTDEEVKAFHEGSHGNPRVQNYALNIGNSEQFAAVLTHARLSLDNIFKDYIEGALTLNFSKGLASEHLDDLSCFPRPLQIKNLTEVLGLPSEELNALCNALSPGLSRDVDGWRFRDEDFDTFLRIRLEERGAALSAHARIAQRMKLIPDSSFAAHHLSEYLFRAEADSQVITLALQGETDIPKQMNEVSRINILRRRVVLGVKSASRTKKSEALVRLTVQAADVARSKSAISELIKDYPDLAVLYTDPNTIEKNYLDNTNQDNYGPAQLRCAALFSRYAEHHDRAREHLNMAEAWIRRWMRMKPDERKRWNIKNRDIAAGAEAVFRLDGPEESNRWLSRWRPLDSVLQACHLLAGALARDIKPSEQLRLFNKLSLHPFAAVWFLVAFKRVGIRPEVELVEAVFLKVEAYTRLDRHDFLNYKGFYGDASGNLQTAIGIEFAELLVGYEIAPGRIIAHLDRFSPLKASYAPHDTHDADRFSSQLQLLALRAELMSNEVDKNELANLLLQTSKKESEYERDEELKRFQSLVAPRFLYYRLRAEAINRSPSLDELMPRLTSVLKGCSEERWRPGGSFDSYFRDALLPLAETALACTGEVGTFLDTLSEAVLDRFKEGAPFFWIKLAEPLLNSLKNVDRGIELLDRADEYLSMHPVSGREHCEELLRAAAMVQPHDAKMGAGLFKQAVSVAKNLNDDLCDRLRYLGYRGETLSRHLEKGEARDLSARLVRLTEETRIYVANEDAYPWQDIFKAVIRIHTPSGFSLFTRWADLDYISIRSSSSELSLNALGKKQIQSDQALGLFRLGWVGQNSASSFIKVLDSTLSNNTIQSTLFRNQLGRVVNWVLRDISRDERPECAKEILNWLVSKSCNQFPEVLPLKKYLDFLEENAVKGIDNNSPSVENNLSKHFPDEKIDWDVFFGNEPIPERLFELLSNAHDLQGYRHREGFYDEVRKRLSSSQRVPYLQALVELPDKQVDSESYLKEWETCLNTWQHSRLVKDWADTGIGELVSRHLPGILGYSFVVDKHLSRLLNLPFMKPERWLEILAPALANWVERLGAWQLYPLANVLAEGLSPESQRLLLNEAICDGEVAIEERQEKSLPSLPDWQIIDDSHTPFATLIFTLLGNPDTRIRWSCLHGLREMDLQNKPELLNVLVGLLDSQSVGGFLPENSHFLWMSARAYLMIYFSRFSAEYPSAMLPHTEAILRHALSKDFPHAQIRELAKCVVLAVERGVPGTLSSDSLQKLEGVNRSVNVEKRDGDLFRLSAKTEREERFNFDPLDTLPYWYTPLGRCFNLHGDDIAAQAENWICDRWGFFERNVPQFRKNTSNREWNLTSNRHGQLPTIEDGRNYLECHAMLLVAGELIDSRSSIREYEDSDYGTWESWLSSYLPKYSEFWLSELRSAAPLEPQLHGFVQSKGEPSRTLNHKDFNECLGLHVSKPYEYLVVASDIKINERGFDQSQCVESALVTPEKAHALLRALQSTNDSSAYRIPPAGNDLEIDEPGFSLCGWIGARSGEKGLDEHDLLLYGMDLYLPIFPKDVQEKLNVNTNKIGKQYFDSSNSSQLIAEVESWSDLHEDREGAKYSAGYRLKINIDRLLSYLQSIQRCLILEVKIDKKESNYGRERKHDYKPPEAILYLLHSDGRIETVEHNYCLRPKNT